jgi:hypothetical protein
VTRRDIGIAIVTSVLAIVGTIASQRITNLFDRAQKATDEQQQRIEKLAESVEAMRTSLSRGDLKAFRSRAQQFVDQNKSHQFAKAGEPRIIDDEVNVLDTNLSAYILYVGEQEDHLSPLCNLSGLLVDSNLGIVDEHVRAFLNFPGSRFTRMYMSSE